ncbi:hypothetical protein [Streptomyces cucumeris]|uniref:hypothetical protein n=1 Tax=Streptomyces cucumeris TaxID=2962890 RepID=UPI003D72FE32
MVADDLTSAAADVLCSDDLLLCSPAQARELALHWRPIGELALTRGYAVTAAAPGNPRHVRDRLGDALARCLGAAPSTEGVVA